MNRTEILILTDSLIPRLNGFCYALTANEEQAEQLLIDAFTVYILQEKSFLAINQVDFNDKVDRHRAKKLLLKELLASCFEMACKKNLSPINLKNVASENIDFFKLSYLQRAVMYLKEVAEYSISELQEIFGLQRHQIIEAYYNAKHGLLGNRKIMTMDF